MNSPAEIVDFWRAAGRERWFRKDEAFDREFSERFLPAHEAAARGELDAWQADAQGDSVQLVHPHVRADLGDVQGVGVRQRRAAVPAEAGAGGPGTRKK